mgnify:CR=1 FL=1
MSSVVINNDTIAPLKRTESRENNPLLRRLVEGKNPEVLTDIYHEDVNIVVWQRQLENKLTRAVNYFLVDNKKLASVLVLTPENCLEVLSDKFDQLQGIKPLLVDITLLVEMYCCLFELKQVGLRLTILDRPMCPRFHVDRIPCRLVTTYQGEATQWLNNNVIDRSKLGAGNQGKSDEQSGLIKNIEDINQLTLGDVAILKGENWDEHKGGGLVHRSPTVSSPGASRLLLTLDFVNE